MVSDEGSKKKNIAETDVMKSFYNASLKVSKKLAHFAAAAVVVCVWALYTHRAFSLDSFQTVFTNISPR